MTDQTTVTGTVKKVIGIYSQSVTTKHKHPVIGRADTLFDLLERWVASRYSWQPSEHLLYTYEDSDHGDFYTIVGTVDVFSEYADLLERRAPSGASGAYQRAVAKGIHEAVEDGDLLDLRHLRLLNGEGA